MDRLGIESEFTAADETHPSAVANSSTSQRLAQAWPVWENLHFSISLSSPRPIIKHFVLNTKSVGHVRIYCNTSEKNPKP